MIRLDGIVRQTAWMRELLYFLLRAREPGLMDAFGLFIAEKKAPRGVRLLSGT